MLNTTPFKRNCTREVSFRLFFALFFRPKIGLVTLDPPRDSDKLRILLQGFV